MPRLIVIATFITLCLTLIILAEGQDDYTSPERMHAGEGLEEKVSDAVLTENRSSDSRPFEDFKPGYASSRGTKDGQERGRRLKRQAGGSLRNKESLNRRVLRQCPGYVPLLRMARVARQLLRTGCPVQDEEVKPWLLLSEKVVITKLERRLKHLYKSLRGDRRILSPGSKESSDPRLGGTLNDAQPSLPQWLSWQGWSQCNDLCVRKRSRSCVTGCEGIDEQSQDCPACCVTGIWAAWTEWPGCTRSCDSQTIYRNRVCTNRRSDKLCFKDCEGIGQESKLVECGPKSVDGNWGNWYPWTPCRELCGRQRIYSTRLCDNPMPAGCGRACQGEGQRSKRCGSRPAPTFWGPWVGWSKCYDCASPRPNTRKRIRRCLPLKVNRTIAQRCLALCRGDPEQRESCQPKQEIFCSHVRTVDSPWSEWGQCALSEDNCFYKSRTRRSCTIDFGPQKCYSKEDVASCQRCWPREVAPEPLKEVHLWSAWQPWSACSDVSQTRTRECILNNEDFADIPCTGVGNETRTCRMEDDPSPTIPRPAVPGPVVPGPVVPGPVVPGPVVPDEVDYGRTLYTVDTSCIMTCEDQSDGLYQSCLGCEFYATCTHGFLHLKMCDRGRFEEWDKLEARCVPAGHSRTCILMQPVHDCTGFPDGNYPSRNGCGHFVTCFGGRLQTQECDSGTEWDQIAQRCSSSPSPTCVRGF